MKSSFILLALFLLICAISSSRIKKSFISVREDNNLHTVIPAHKIKTISHVKNLKQDIKELSNLYKPKFTQVESKKKVEYELPIIRKQQIQSNQNTQWTQPQFSRNSNRSRSQFTEPTIVDTPYHPSIRMTSTIDRENTARSESFSSRRVGNTIKYDEPEIIRRKYTSNEFSIPFMQPVNTKGKDDRKDVFIYSIDSD